MGCSPYRAARHCHSKSSASELHPIGQAYAGALAENQAKVAMTENAPALFISQIMTGTLLSRMVG